MYAVLEPTLALAGLLGVMAFSVGRVVVRRRSDPRRILARSTHASLMLGLGIWTVLFVLRHDVVTVVGLLLAMALLHRRNRALAGGDAEHAREQDSLSRQEYRPPSR